MKCSTPPMLLIAVALTFGACGADADVSTADTADATTSTTAPPADPQLDKDEPVDGLTRFWIKSDLVDCVGEAPQKCMQVSESEDGEHYFFFYDQIQGFTFEPGTAYVLDVRVEEVPDPPADASSLKYTLVEVIESN